MNVRNRTSAVFSLDSSPLFETVTRGVAYLQAQNVGDKLKALAVSLTAAKKTILKLEKNVSNIRQKTKALAQMLKKTSDPSALRAENDSLKRMVEDAVSECLSRTK